MPPPLLLPLRLPPPKPERLLPLLPLLPDELRFVLPDRLLLLPLLDRLEDEEALDRLLLLEPELLRSCSTEATSEALAFSR